MRRRAGRRIAGRRRPQNRRLAAKWNFSGVGRRDERRRYAGLSPESVRIIQNTCCEIFTSGKASPCGNTGTLSTANDAAAASNADRAFSKKMHGKVLHFPKMGTFERDCRSRPSLTCAGGLPHAVAVFQTAAYGCFGSEHCRGQKSSNESRTPLRESAARPRKHALRIRLKILRCVFDGFFIVLARSCPAPPSANFPRKPAKNRLKLRFPFRN